MCITMEDTMRVYAVVADYGYDGQNVLTLWDDQKSARAHADDLQATTREGDPTRYVVRDYEVHTFEEFQDKREWRKRWMPE